MRPFLLLCCAVAIVGCAKPDTKADTAAATPAPPPPPPPITLADVAGKWNVVGKNEAGDSTLLTYVVTATADTMGWKIQFTDRKNPIAMRVVMVSGDSIVADAGPFPSALRKGVQVRAHSVMRLRDGKLVGNTTAHYNVKTADSVRVLSTEGTRAP